MTVYRTTDDRELLETSLIGGIRQIQFDPQGGDLTAISEEGIAHALPLSARPRIPWLELSISARNTSYSPDGALLALVCADGVTWFYSFSSQRWVYTRDHDSDIFSGNFSRTGADFVSTDRNGVVIIRDILQTFKEEPP